MNVARKSTTKLPQNWDQMQKLQSHEDEADSEVASTDSRDSFQDALFNLKALSGTSDTIQSDRSELKDLQTSSTLASNDKPETASLPKQSTDEGALEQIEHIVGDKKECSDEAQENSVASCAKSKVRGRTDLGSEEEDDILIINEDEPKQKKSKQSKEDVIQKDAELNNKTVVGSSSCSSTKTPSRMVGEKIRTTVHNLMSKLAQSNPDVNSLLSKTKTEDCNDSGSSGTASPLQVRHDKGNLFDKFDIPERDSSSSQDDHENGEISKSSASEKPDGALGKNASVEDSKSSENDEKSTAEEVKQPDIKTEEQSSLSLHTCPSDTTSVGSPKCDAAVVPAVIPTTTVDSKSSCSSSNKTAINGECGPCSDDSLLAQDNSVDGSHSENVASECSGLTEAYSKSEKCTSPSSEIFKKPEDKDIGLSESGDKAPVNTTDPKPVDGVTEKAASCESNSLKEGTVDTDRKRIHESISQEAEESLPPKKSRLDEVIGKLGERVTFPSDVPENDSFDNDSIPGDTDSVEKQSEEISASTSDEEEDKPSSDSKVKTMKITAKELEALVEAATKASIERYQSAEVLALNRRVEELLETQEEWRQKAKSLERQVLNLTVLQQRLEKRKAHTAALKSITTRSIAVGVTEEKLKTGTPQKTPGNKTPPATPPATLQSALVLASGSQLNGRPVVSVPTHATSVSSGPVTCTPNTISRNTSVAHLLSQTARMPTVASCSAASRTATGKVTNTVPRLPVTVATLPGTANSAISSVSRGSVTGSVTPSTSLVLVSTVPAAPPGKTGTQGSTTSLVTPAGSAQVKFIDLTMEDDNGTAKQSGKTAGTVRAMVPQQVMRPVTTLSQAVPGPSSTILLSTPAGTQIVNAGNLTRPGMLQVVTIANPQTLRPGSIFTVMPGQAGGGMRPPAAATTLTTNARDTAPLVMAQQLPAGMTFVRPSPSILGPGAVVRPTATPSGTGTTSVVSSARMPVTLTTVPPQASAPRPLQQDPPTASALAAAAKKNIHPAPLPESLRPRDLPTGLKPPPPSPGLKISRVKQGIVLSWNMNIPADCVEIASYQLFAYQETSAVPQTSLWKKVGDVKALPLPMACTLTQFQDGNKYHFAVRAVDVHGRSGPFSEPSFIYLTKAA